MDLMTIRTVIEVCAFAAFLGILAWTFSSRRRADYEEAAKLPFKDHE
jgi:cytochrome c oxidase cbb3-type subunit 4